MGAYRFTPSLSVVQAQVVEVLEAEMTKQEKILKRALEMACKFISENYTECEKCPFFVADGMCGKCEDIFKIEFIRKAKEELK